MAVAHVDKRVNLIVNSVAIRERQGVSSSLGLKHDSYFDFDQEYFGGYRLDKPGEHYGLCSRPANLTPT